jgi:hypothetical protein
VAQSVKAAVASLFASIRRPKTIESLRIRQYSDSAPDDAQQLRDDEDHAGQRSAAEADEQNRAAVAQSFKADVASLLAQI